MKSVSFSDLRKSSDMTNRIDQTTNSGDSNIKRSSSYKNLTYYSSSEDILKRFSSKTNELKNNKDGYRSDESHNEIFGNLKEKPLIEIPRENTSIEKQRDKYQDMKMSSSSESIIQELKAVISDQEKTISHLQETNLLLQNEAYKNGEEIKFQENRIKYLEHMLAAFNTNLQENKKISSHNNEESLFTGLVNNSNTTPYSSLKTKVNPDRNTSAENVKSSSSNYTREAGNNYNEISTDLKKRPSSADSSLNNAYKFIDNSSEKDKRYQFLQSSIGSYTSDTEDRADVRNYDTGPNQKQIQIDYVARHRQKLERDRSSNLTDFKSRLDEFTKYAKRSAEQNSLNPHSFTMPVNYDGKSSKKYPGAPDNYNDQQYKPRSKGTTQTTDSRPPIDPYYKQRKSMPVDVKSTYDRAAPSSTIKVQDLTVDEDEHLKERVQKILEKHNYPATAYRTDNNRKTSEYTQKGSSDYYSSVPSNVSNSRGYERNSSDSRYGYHSKDPMNTNESNIPRLDLTLYNNTSTNDLITKYLNYQGSTNVS